ncbi:serine/arginine repetitive matrix protein 1-like [Ursus americanus]|uniref:serine/arginine repetitive matrix protein 1-like n=1 Tax=Ursus americanus TaxID=9643 RepID=UPI001E67CF22|nr:serine/arginine repetitive matrix protein 1-like [Ursus americanus]
MHAAGSFPAVSLWLSGSFHCNRGFSPHRLPPCGQGSADRRLQGRCHCSCRLGGRGGLWRTRPRLWSLPPPHTTAAASLESPPRRSFPRRRVSPRDRPNGGRRRPRASPKNPDRSQSPERAEGASHSRSPEPLRKGPKFSERPSGRTAGGGRSAMLDALLVE